MQYEQSRQQLMMFRYAAPIPAAPLPSGWTIRSMAGDEGALWAYIAGECGFLGGDADPQTRWMNAMGRDPQVRPDNVFFACDETGRPVATATARLLAGADAGKFPPSASGLGYLHYVAALPECRGKGVGRAVTSAVLRRFAELGLGDCVLNTDDHRLPAIGLYLRMGWIPVLNDPGMAARWDQVLRSLGLPDRPAAIDKEGVRAEL